MAYMNLLIIVLYPFFQRPNEPSNNNNQRNQRFQREKLVTKKHQQRTHGSNCSDPEVVCALPVEFNYDPRPLPRQVTCTSAARLGKLLGPRC